MADIGSLNVKLTADINRFVSGMNAAKSAVSIFATGATTLAASAGAAIIAMGNDAIEAQQKIGKLATNTGETVANLKALQVAAGSLDVVDSALGKMNVNIGKAVNGSAEMQETFARLGLDSEKLAKTNPADAFAQIAERISKLGTDAERAAAGQAIFGASARELDAVLSGGMASIDAARASVERFGLVMSEAAQRDVALLTQQQKELDLAMEGMGNRASGVAGIVKRSWIGLKGIFVDVGTLLSGGPTDVVELAPQLAAQSKIRAEVEATMNARRAEAAIRKKAADEAAEVARKESEARRLRGTLVDPELQGEIERLGELKRKLVAEEQFGQGELAKIEMERRRSHTDEQANVLAGLAREVDAMNEAKRAKEEAIKLDEKAAEAKRQYNDAIEQNLAGIADGVRSENLTPLEKYQDKLRELKGALDAGFISQQDFNRAALNAENSLASELALPDKARFAGAAEAGSREAFSAVAQFKAGGQEQGKDLKTLIDVARRQQQALDDIARQTRENNALTFAEF